MFLFLGREIWSGLILRIVHRWSVGSLALNILCKGTTERFWSVVIVYQ